VLVGCIALLGGGRQIGSRAEPATATATPTAGNRRPIEECWIKHESKRADIRGLEVCGVSVIELPATERRPSLATTTPTTGASLHDPIERLPLSSRLVAKLRAEGIEEIAQLRARLFELLPTLQTMGTGAFVEVRYALACYEVFLRTPSIALRPIGAKFLAPASDLGLDGAIAKKVAQHAPSIAEIVTRSESDWLKTNGFGRGSLQKLKDALAAAGFELGREWHELAS
jgi:DNA-directed RNA polymerase alpha subunit